MILLEISKFEQNIAIISLFIAGVSLLVSFRSTFLAKKALAISKKELDNKQPDFDLYYNNGYRFTSLVDNHPNRILLFHLSINNKSQFRNTLKSDLEIEYLRSDDSVAKCIVEHNPGLTKHLKNQEMTIFPIDIEIEPKTSMTKWLIFQQPNYLDIDHRIEKYKIRFSDLDGNKTSLEASLIKEIND